MLFTDDTDAALQAAVALVNSTDEPGDPLGSVDDLSAFLAYWPYTGRVDATQAELDAVRRLRPALRALLLAERDDAADFGRASAPEAAVHPGDGWRQQTSSDTSWPIGAASRAAIPAW